jgi:hypothetical protein
VWLKENKPHYWERLRDLSQTPNLVTYKFNRTETFEELDKRLEEKVKNNKAQLKLF